MSETKTGRIDRNVMFDEVKRIPLTKEKDLTMSRVIDKDAGKLLGLNLNYYVRSDNGGYTGYQKGGIYIPIEKFGVVSTMIKEFLDKELAFTIDQSDIEAGSPCPRCGVDRVNNYELGEIHRDSEGEITHWDAQCGGCGLKGVIFND